MTRNLKSTKAMVIGDDSQGSVSDAIKQVISNELERGITITEMLEKEKSIVISNPYHNAVYASTLPIKSYFPKPRSKFHR